VTEKNSRPISRLNGPFIESGGKTLSPTGTQKYYSTVLQLRRQLNDQSPVHNPSPPFPQNSPLSFFRCPFSFSHNPSLVVGPKANLAHHRACRLLFCSDRFNSYWNLNIYGHFKVGERYFEKRDYFSYDFHPTRFTGRSLGPP
jgi:hypothetical protein